MSQSRRGRRRAENHRPVMIMSLWFRCCFLRLLESEAAEARMIVRPTAERPSERPLVLEDRHVVDARMAHRHQPLSIELPVLVAK